jgi:hypothetical protein
MALEEVQMHPIDLPKLILIKNCFKFAYAKETHEDQDGGVII